jgi:uncharacterized protein YegL
MSKKQQKPITYAVIILDKSGSMARTKNATITGFNEQVQQLIEDSKTQTISCCLVTFNGEVFEHLWCVPANELVEATPEDFIPSGNTAMRDAVGYTVQKLLNTTDHENPNVSYLVTVISDGETLNDKHYSVPQLRELTEGCQATKRWTFNYIGCSAPYLVEIARQTGTPIANMAAWSNSSADAALDGFKNNRARQKKFFACRAAGSASSELYASDSAGIVADFNLKLDDSFPELSNPYIPKPEDIIAPDLNVKIDFNAVIARGPKYVATPSPAYNGEALFKNSQKVQWTT